MKKRRSLLLVMVMVFALLVAACDGCSSSNDDYSSSNDDYYGGDPQPTTLPMPTETCPLLTTGMMTIGGAQVSLTVGPANTPGPMLFYWHATGMNYEEVKYGFSDAMADVQANGGVVASFTSTMAATTSDR